MAAQCANCGSSNIQHGLDRILCFDCGKQSWEDTEKGVVSDEDLNVPGVLNPDDPDAPRRIQSYLPHGVDEPAPMPDGEQIAPAAKKAIEEGHGPDTRISPNIPVDNGGKGKRTSKASESKASEPKSSSTAS